jgi:hypothetical protein
LVLRRGQNPEESAGRKKTFPVRQWIEPIPPAPPLLVLVSHVCRYSGVAGPCIKKQGLRYMSFHPFVNFEERKAVILNMKLFNLKTLTKTQRDKDFYSTLWTFVPLRLCERINLERLKFDNFRGLIHNLYIS